MQAVRRLALNEKREEMQTKCEYRDPRPTDRVGTWIDYPDPFGADRVVEVVPGADADKYRYVPNPLDEFKYRYVPNPLDNDKYKVQPNQRIELNHDFESIGRGVA